MKLIALLCLVGLAAANQQGSLFRVGSEYTFKYEGRMLTGLPELATHYSGLGMKCNVHVQVPSQNEYRISISQVKYAKVNQALQGQGTDDQNNWRNIGLPEFTDVPSDSAKHLGKPTILKLKSGSGQFESLTVSGEEPEWSVNFKKALAVLFQARTVQPNIPSSENMLEEQQHQMEEGMGGNGDIVYWRTQEPSLEGVCQVSYQVNELPEYIVRENQQAVPFPKACGGSGAKFFEIVRSRDVNSCSSRSKFGFFKPGFLRCTTDNCDGMSTRSSVTRYIACGSSKADMRIQSIVNDGEMEIDLMGTNTERFVTGNKQNLTLINQAPVGSAMPEPSSPIKKESLLYEYKSKSSSKLPAVISKLTGKLAPEGIAAVKLASIDAQGSFNPADLIKEMIQSFEQLVNQDLDKDQQDLAEKEVAMRVLKLARGFSLMDKATINQLFETLKNKFSSNQQNKQTMENIFFDTVIMGGSHANVEFLKEKILGNQIGDLQTATILTGMPNYIVVPNQDILSTIFELVTGIRSSSSQRSSIVYHQALLGFTSLVNKACISQNRGEAYPEAVYGELCNPQSDIVLQKVIPYLQQELEQSTCPDHKSLVLVAIGSLGHKATLSTLLPYVQGTKTISDKQNMKQTGRFLALYSLVPIGAQYPGLVEPALFSILSNQAEPTELRVAAFNALLRLNPSETYLHRIASLTWREQDQQVLKVINLALYTLSSQRNIEPATTTYNSLPRKAYAIYPLIRKPANSLPSSGTYVNSDFLRELNAGFADVTSWTTNGQSYVPADFYNRLVLLFNRYQFNAFEGGYHVTGAQDLIQQTIELLTPSQSHLSKEELAQSIKNKDLSSEWKSIIDKLGLKDVKDAGVPEASAFINVLESAPIFASVNGKTLKEKLQKLVKNFDLKKTICGSHQVNIQKSNNLMSHVVNIPNDMGLPTVIEFHTPSVFSARGQVNIDCSNFNRFVPKVEVSVKSLLQSSYTGYIGTVLPFTSEFVATGNEQTATFNLPVEISASLDTHEQKIDAKLNFNNNKNDQPGNIDLLHYQGRPFTVAQKIQDMSNPMTLDSSLKAIRSPSKISTVEKSFGKDKVGIDMHAIVKTESRFTDLRSVFDKLRLYNYNPVNALRMPMASTAQSEKNKASCRFHQIILRIDQTQTQTKSVEFNIKWGYATKLQGGQIKYTSLKIQKDQMSYPQLSLLLPIQLESDVIGTKSGHQQRQQQLKKLMEETKLKSGYGINLDFQAVITNQDGTTSTIKYSLNHAYGQQEFLKQKWNVRLQNKSGGSQWALCANGQAEVPHAPLWNAHQIRSSNLQFSLNSDITWGNNCQGSRISMRSNSRVSQKQKQISSTSSEAQLYQKMKESRVPLADMSLVAEQVRRQASTLDEIDLTIKYQNVGDQVIKVPRYFSEYLKSFLWPYLKVTNSGASSGSQSGKHSTQTDWTFNYNTEKNTVDITLHKEDETIVFKHVRVPVNFLGMFQPSDAIKKMEKAQNSYSFVYPVCQLEGNWMKSYNNKTIFTSIDQCPHLLAGDCSFRKSWGITARNVSDNHDSAKELEVYIGKTIIKISPSDASSRYSSDLKVYVNNTQLSSLSVNNGHVTIKDNKQDYVADAFMSKDGVVTLQFLNCPVMGGPSVIVKFNGAKAEIKTSPMYRGSVCGLCGDLSGQKLKGLVGPKQCVYSKPEILSASYRISGLSGKSCPALPGRVEQALQHENSECLKAKEDNPTNILKSMEAQVGPCTRHTHEIIEEVTRYCFSSKPVISCSSICRPSQLTDKRTGFTCMPKGRVAERYVEKIRRGEILSELAAMEVDFQTVLAMPRSCVQSQA